jgi:expansin (peptidoglycan-binding protein)
VSLPADASVDATGSTPGNGAPPFGVAQTGVATYYTGDGTGACSFDADPNDMDFAAMDQPEWAGSAVCGACANVVGPNGSVTLRIVDLCPGCEAGHLDLSQQAFGKIAALSAGRVPVTWTLVPCAVTGPVTYQYKDGSSQYWTAIQVRNHRLPIAKLEWKGPSGWVDVPLASYNYFVQASGVGTGSVGVRITAWDGESLEDTLTPVVPSTVVTGAGQF